MVPTLVESEQNPHDFNDRDEPLHLPSHCGTDAQVEASASASASNCPTPVLLLRSPSFPPPLSTTLPKRRLSFSSRYPPPNIQITRCSLGVSSGAFLSSALNSPPVHSSFSDLFDRKEKQQEKKENDSKYEHASDDHEEEDHGHGHGHPRRPLGRVIHTPLFSLFVFLLCLLFLSHSLSFDARPNIRLQAQSGPASDPLDPDTTIPRPSLRGRLFANLARFKFPTIPSIPHFDLHLDHLPPPGAALHSRHARNGDEDASAVNFAVNNGLGFDSDLSFGWGSEGSKSRHLAIAQRRAGTETGNEDLAVNRARSPSSAPAAKGMGIPIAQSLPSAVYPSSPDKGHSSEPTPTAPPSPSRHLDARAASTSHASTVFSNPDAYRDPSAVKTDSDSDGDASSASSTPTAAAGGKRGWGSRDVRRVGVDVE